MIELNSVRTKNCLLESKPKPYADLTSSSTQTDSASGVPGHNLPKAAKKPLHDKEAKALYLSTHIDELTNDIEQLQHSLLGTRGNMDEIKEEMDYMSPIEGKENSCWFQENSQVFGECLSGNKESGRLAKLQEEYNKTKEKLAGYQQNNELYLSEIKALKEQLASRSTESASARTLKARVCELEKEKETLIAGSQEELNEYKAMIADMKRQIESYKKQMASLEGEYLKLKLEREQLEDKLNKKLPLMGYLKTGTSHIK